MVLSLHGDCPDGVHILCIRYRVAHCNQSPAISNCMVLSLYLHVPVGCGQFLHVWIPAMAVVGWPRSRSCRDPCHSPALAIRQSSSPRGATGYQAVSSGRDPVPWIQWPFPIPDHQHCKGDIYSTVEPTPCPASYNHVRTAAALWWEHRYELFHSHPGGRWPGREFHSQPISQWHVHDVQVFLHSVRVVFLHWCSGAPELALLWYHSSNAFRHISCSIHQVSTGESCPPSC